MMKMQKKTQKGAVLPRPAENAKVSDGNRKKSAREISPGCQGKILKLAGWHGFCKGFFLKYTDCCPPAVYQWSGRVRAHHNIYGHRSMLRWLGVSEPD